MICKAGHITGGVKSMYSGHMLMAAVVLLLVVLV
jgi:hypothetical protein